VLPQATLTGAGLLGAVARLLADRGALASMGERARTLAIPDAAERIARLITEVAGPGAAARRRKGQRV
jgi:UDP-N-acetylglucosamine:LPS N-acetylglucosamine transferase